MKPLERTLPDLVFTTEDSERCSCGIRSIGAPLAGMPMSGRPGLSLHGLWGGVMVPVRRSSAMARKGMVLSGSGGAEEGRALR